MIITTTNSIQGRKIADYKGIVAGETIMEAQQLVAISLEGSVG